MDLMEFDGIERLCGDGLVGDGQDDRLRARIFLDVLF
jgi:hypothetical protein